MQWARSSLFIGISIFSILLNAGDLVDQARKSLLPSTDRPLFTTRYEQEKERLSALKKDRQELLDKEKVFISGIAKQLEGFKQLILSYEQALQAEPDRDAIKKKLELLLELVQLLNDKKQVYEQKKTLLDEQIKLRQEYLADPDLKKFYTSLNADKSEFSFDEDLLKKYEMIMEQEKHLQLLAEQESHALAELENRKRAMGTAIDAVQKKEKQTNEHSEEILGLTPRDRAEIHQLKDQIASERKIVNEWRVQEIEQKLDLIRLKLFIAQHQLEILNDVFTKIKQGTRVAHADVALALEELDKKKQQCFIIKDMYRQEAERIGTTLKEKEREFEILSKRYNIALDTELNEWAKAPRARAASYTALAQVSELNEDVQLLKRKKELLEAQAALEEERLRFENLRLSVKESFYRMSGRKFATEEEVTREIKKYDTPRAEAKANIALYKERINTISGFLATKKKALENIKDKLLQSERLKSTAFAGQEADYERYITALKNAEIKVHEQIETIAKSAQLYSDISSLLQNTLKHIEFINSELSSITIWYRPEHAISWTGLKQSVPDLMLFFRSVSNYIRTLHLPGIIATIKMVFVSWWDIFFFIFKVLILLAVLFILRHYLPAITSKLISLENAPSGVRWVSLLTAIVLGFGLRHIISLIVWAMLYLLFFSHPLPDPYPLILFYLFSIPYLLYLANRLMRYIVHFNVKYDYVLLSKEYQRRFIVVFSLLIYATIIIFFLREAFILGNYRKSELPTILLAINFIIFQISALLLLSKDQILSLIPTRNNFWMWVREMVDNYYYLIQLIFIAIIVMSNPYVGYGRLVLYVIKRVFFTAILLQLLLWLHEWLKRVTSRIFFDIDVEDEIVRDRFSYAKTWYGMFVVGILLAVTFVGCIIAARIWGWPEMLIKISTWHDVLAWVKTPLLLENTQSPISLYTFIRIISFLITGIFIGFIINKFVLGRIFDILLIESGVQHTISSLMRYLVIITAIIVGFKSVGLGELVWYLMGALILGIGWVIKDPMADLVAYFIIILQQPIKVGDYIWIDETTNGVVRRINPRAVELRRKNSTTLVLPNSYITTRAITNWNFVRGFIAFDDISLTIPYQHDPIKVKELLLRVLDENRAILKNPRPIVRLEQFNELGYVFMVRGFLSSQYTLDMWDIASDVRLTMVKRLKEHGIEPACAMRFFMARPPSVLGEKSE